MTSLLSRLAWLVMGGFVSFASAAPDGWSERSPRDEIRPKFSGLDHRFGRLRESVDG
jgi:hypothetical protein